MRERLFSTRIEEYCKAIRSLDALDRALDGDAVSSEEYHAIIDKLDKRTIKLFKIENKGEFLPALLSSIIKLTPINFLKGKIFQQYADGYYTKLVVEINGAVFRATVKLTHDQYLKSKSGIIENCKIDLDIIQVDKQNKLTYKPIASSIKLEIDNGQSTIVASAEVGGELSAQRKAETLGSEYSTHVKRELFRPRPHQTELLEALAQAGQRKNLIVAGTGAGKTGVILGFAEAVASKTIIAVPEELVDQMIEDSNLFGIKGRIKKLKKQDSYDDTSLDMDESEVLVVSHEQLIELEKQGLLKNKSIILDEVQQVSQDKGKNEVLERQEAFARILDSSHGNHVVETSAQLL